MTPCLSHDFPLMYLKRNTTTRLLNWLTLVSMQLLTYETMFECIVWTMRRTGRRVHCIKDTTLRNVLTYRDMPVCKYSHICICVSVCNVSPNFPMFYDNRHVSTQISPLCHVHAQVYMIKDTSNHTFLSYGDMSEYSLALSVPLVWLKRMSLNNFWHTKQRFWNIVCLHRRVCTQVLRLRGVGTNQNTVFCHAI